MEKVVYLLGAGFSAPLGLPVISNFREKSQDVYLSDKFKYGYFEDVFKAIQDLAAVKNVYRSDLHNMEEVLSLLAMSDFLQERALPQKFMQYIHDVITFYTPPIPETFPPGNWHEWLFASKDEPNNLQYQPYGYFIGALLNLQFSKVGTKYTGYEIEAATDMHPRTTYAVITLNYDTIPESVAAYCRAQFHSQAPLPGFSTQAAEHGSRFQPGGPVPLAKLHGSIDSGTIVPPTWSKESSSEISAAWDLAHQLLQEATELRILGFSLPEGDSSIRYLLKSATIANQSLKHIDVICLDEDDSVKARYDKLISFPKFRFANRDISHYLAEARRIHAENTWNSDLELRLNRLELMHKQFVSSPVDRTLAMRL